MQIHLKASMLKMYGGLYTAGGNTANVTTAIDGDDGAGANSGAGWVQCAVSALRRRSTHWLAIDLEGLFFVSKVRATFRYDSGRNVAVFIGNPVLNGRYEYQCGDRLPDVNSVQRAPHWYTFACQPARWASHVSIQRIEADLIQICEVEVYYSQNTTVGMLLLLSIPPCNNIHCSASFLLCSTQELTFLSLRCPILEKQFLWVNRCRVRQVSYHPMQQTCYGSSGCIPTDRPSRNSQPTV